MAVEVVIKTRAEGDGLHVTVNELNKVGDAAKAQEGKLGGFLSGLKTVGLVSGGLMAGGILAAGKAGLDFNNSIEQVTAKLNAFTKDGKKSAELLEQIKKEASTTPFAFEEMAQATGNLMSSAKAAGVPVMDLVKQAEILAASNPAQGLEGAAIALKEAAGGDFTSIIERFDLPRQRINELKKQGVPALEAVSIAMKEMGLDADLVTNMAGTMQGRWSTTMDTFTNLAAQVTQPIFDTLSGGLGGFNTMLESNTPRLTAFAGQLATGVGNAIQGTVKLFGDLGGAFHEAGGGTLGIGAAINVLIGDLFGLNTNIGFVVTDGINFLMDAFSQAQGVVTQVIGVIKANLPQALATGQQVFTDLSEMIKERMAAIQSVIGAILPIILAFWKENGASIMETWKVVWTQVQAILKTASAIVNQLLLIVGGFIKNHGTEIVAVLTAAWNIISSVIKTALGLISGIVSAALLLLKGDFGGAWKVIQETAATFVTDLLGVIKNLASGIGSAMNLVISAVKDAWGALVRAAPELGKGMINGIAQGISDGVGFLKNAISDALNSALKAAKDKLGIKSPSVVFAQQLGLPMAQGMAQGMSQNQGLVRSAGMQLASAGVSGAQSVQVGGSVGVNISMRGDMGRFMSASVDNQVTVMARRADARGRFS